MELIQSELNKPLLGSDQDVSASVKYTQLVYNRTTKTNYYDLEKADLDTEGPFDLLIVDGPGDVTNRWAAWELLKKYLSPSVIIILDDGDTDVIRHTVQSWLNDNNSLSARYYPTVKGTWMLWDKENNKGLPLP